MVRRRVGNLIHISISEISLNMPKYAKAARITICWNKLKQFSFKLAEPLSCIWIEFHVLSALIWHIAVVSTIYLFSQCVWMLSNSTYHKTQVESFSEEQWLVVFRPILLSCIIVWWTALDNTTIRNRFRNIQHIVLISISGAFRTRTSDALNTRFLLPPLNLVGKQNAANATALLAANNQCGDLSVGHSTITLGLVPTNPVH